MNAWALRTIAIMGLCLLAYFFPLVRVVPLSALAESSPADAFEPAAFAVEFWETRLVASVDQAAPAADVVAALAADAQAAKEQYGRTLGVGRSFFVYVKGEGEVVEAGPRSVTVELDDGPTALVSISRGPLFDTALRDATGLLRIDDFADMRDFNALSAELNKLCEQRVTPSLSEVQQGSRLRFVGCGRVASPSRFKPPLVLSPVVIEGP